MEWKTWKTRWSGYVKWAEVFEQQFPQLPPGPGPDVCPQANAELWRNNGGWELVLRFVPCHWAELLSGSGKWEVCPPRLEVERLVAVRRGIALPTEQDVNPSMISRGPGGYLQHCLDLPSSEIGTGFQDGFTDAVNEWFVARLGYRIRGFAFVYNVPEWIELPGIGSTILNRWLRRSPDEILGEPVYYA